MINKYLIHQIIDNDINVLDLSNIIITEDDIELIKNLFKINTSITQIILNSFNITQLNIISKLLINNKSFNTLNFNYIRYDNLVILVGILKIADIFKNCINLKTIKLYVKNIKDVNYIINSFKQKDISIDYNINYSSFKIDEQLLLINIIKK